MEVKHEETPPGQSVIPQDEVTDEDLMKRIKDIGNDIQKRYCGKFSAKPTMLPPIPNCWQYIDKFPDQGLTSKNEDDKRRQEDYAAEVEVYRALEDLEESFVVLHSLSYTNRQFKLFKKDFQFDSKDANKMAGQCDLVVIGKNYVVIIEVSNARKDDTKTTNKGLKKALKKKEKQGKRTKELVEGMLRCVDSEDVESSLYITWYCAFLSLSSDSRQIFTEQQRSNIIFADSFTSFRQWWKEKVADKTAAVSVSDCKISCLKDMLLGLWNIDSQNQIPKGNCSFGSNIMKVDTLLKNANITYGFRNPEDPEYNNPNFVEAGDNFKKFGIEFLSLEQDTIYKSTEQFLWVNGPAGSGKTILILGKAIEAALTGKVVIFKNMSEERSKKMYQEALEKSGTSFSVVDTNVETSNFSSLDIDAIADDFAGKTSQALDKCSVALLEFGNTESCPVYHVSNYCGGLQMINKTISHIVQRLCQKSRQPLICFIDDEQCLLEDKLYDRQKRIVEFEKLISVANNDCSIWIFTDIAQSPDHMAPENLPSLLPEIDSMLQTYSPLALSRNFRSTFEIGTLLESIRENIMFSTRQLSGHFIRGPKPTLYYGNLTERQPKLNKVREIVVSEIEKVIDSEDIKPLDVGFIGNSEQSRSFLAEILLERKLDQYQVFVMLQTHTPQSGQPYFSSWT
ncbi:hypothetical protein ACHWQZ_G007044 [Mnemiopsis leidyi]